VKFNSLYTHQKRLFEALRKDEKRTYILLHVMSLVIIGLEVLGLAILFMLLIMILEPDATENMTSYFPNLSHCNSRDWIVFLGGSFVVKNIVQLALNRWQLKSIFEITANLSDRIYVQTFNAELSLVKKVTSGDRINEITSITNSLPNQIILPALTASAEITFVFVAFLVLFYLYPVLLLWLCVFLIPPTVLFLLIGRKRLSRYGQFMRDAMPGLYTLVTSSIFGFSEIKLFNLRAQMGNEFRRVRDEVYDKRIKSLLLSAMAPQRFMEVIAIVAICVMAGLSVVTNELSSVHVTLVLFITAAFRLLPSLNRIVGSVNTLNTFANILDFLPDKSNENSIKDKYELGRFESLKMNKLSFSFDGTNAVLDAVDFGINSGDFIGISGESGSGKTTLINIILGFYNVDDSQLTINNYPLQHVLQQWQQKIGLVKQDPFMLSGSIKDNIVFGAEEDDLLLLKVVEQTQLTEWIDSLENGLETDVGELGTMVSGGQRQRIALARCLYRDTEVLIFDEATNALDVKNKSVILELIEELNTEKKTIIMVSHDEEVIKRAKRTLRLR